MFSTIRDMFPVGISLAVALKIIVLLRNLRNNDRDSSLKNIDTIAKLNFCQLIAIHKRK